MIVLGSGVLPSLSYTPTTMVPGEIEGDELDAELSEYVPFTWNDNPTVEFCVGLEISMDTDGLGIRVGE